MQRFFVEHHQIDRDRHEIRITGNDVNHIVNVLRMKKDEELWISDKEKEYHCVIENAGENEVLLHISLTRMPTSVIRMPLMQRAVMSLPA